MPNLKKWEALAQAQESPAQEISGCGDEKSRFCLFLAFREARQVIIPPSNVNGEPPLCWVRARLVDVNGVAFEDPSEKAVESRKCAFTKVPSFGNVPLLLGDVHRIGTGIEALEDTYLRVELVYEKTSQWAPPQVVTVGSEDVSLFLLSPLGDELEYACRLKKAAAAGGGGSACAGPVGGGGDHRATSGGGSEGELSVRMYLFKTPMDNARLASSMRAFESFDTDGGGTIDGDELGAVLDHLGHPSSDLQVHQMISSVDMNGSGEIEIHEFLTLMDGIDGVEGGGGGLCGVEGVVAAVAEKLSFKLGDVASKYRSVKKKRGGGRRRTRKTSEGSSGGGGGGGGDDEAGEECDGSGSLPPPCFLTLSGRVRQTKHHGNASEEDEDEETGEETKDRDGKGGVFAGGGGVVNEGEKPPSWAPSPSPSLASPSSELMSLEQLVLHLDTHFPHALMALQGKQQAFLLRAKRELDHLRTCGGGDGGSGVGGVACFENEKSAAAMLEVRARRAAEAVGHALCDLGSAEAKLKEAQAAEKTIWAQVDVLVRLSMASAPSSTASTSASSAVGEDAGAPLPQADEIAAPVIPDGLPEALAMANLLAAKLQAHWTKFMRPPTTADTTAATLAGKEPQTGAARRAVRKRSSAESAAAAVSIGGGAGFRVLNPLCDDRPNTLPPPPTNSLLEAKPSPTSSTFDRLQLRDHALFRSILKYAAAAAAAPVATATARGADLVTAAVAAALDFKVVDSRPITAVASPAALPASYAPPPSSKEAAAEAAAAVAGSEREAKAVIQEAWGKRITARRHAESLIESMDDLLAEVADALDE